MDECALCVCKMEYYSEIKKKKTSICENMDGPRGIILSEKSQTGKDNTV